MAKRRGSSGRAAGEQRAAGQGRAAGEGRVVVITGSSRGLGFCLAEELLKRGARLTINGRSGRTVQQALGRLEPYAERIQAQVCDVSDASQVQALWNAAVARWGRVDIWINNAGVAQDYAPAWELQVEAINRLVATNLLGVIHGSRTALRGMRAQGGGAIYNMEGWGADGKRRSGLSVYGTTKRALRYFSRALADEAAGGPVLVGTLSPGMMVTAFLLDPMKTMADPQRMRRVVNILGDRPETVARFLACKILANQRHGAHFAWLSAAKVLGRFLAALVRKRDLFADRPV